MLRQLSARFPLSPSRPANDESRSSASPAAARSRQPAVRRRRAAPDCFERSAPRRARNLDRAPRRNLSLEPHAQRQADPAQINALAGVGGRRAAGGKKDAARRRLARLRRGPATLAGPTFRGADPERAGAYLPCMAAARIRDVLSRMIRGSTVVPSTRALRTSLPEMKTGFSSLCFSIKSTRPTES